MRQKNDTMDNDNVEAINLERQNKIEVKIYGKMITLVSDESKDYILDIAKYLNEKIDKMNNIHNAMTKTILLSINVADELFKAREQNKNMEMELANLKAQIAKSNINARKGTNK